MCIRDRYRCRRHAASSVRPSDSATVPPSPPRTHHHWSRWRCTARSSNYPVSCLSPLPRPAGRRPPTCYLSSADKQAIAFCTLSRLRRSLDARQSTSHAQIYCVLFYSADGHSTPTFRPGQTSKLLSTIVPMFHTSLGLNWTAEWADHVS